MKVVKVVAIVLLAIFLIVSGFVGLTGATLPVVIHQILNLIEIGAGVLFFVALGCEKCGICGIEK